jgi:hypothetical protein
MTTWIDVMAMASALREKRDGSEPLDGRDAEHLLATLLDFHERAVAFKVSPRESTTDPAGARRRGG